MNPFQRARNEALKTRERLCPGHGEEPLAAKDLLATVEDELELALMSVAPSYPELGGGSAVLRRGQQTIYVSNEFDEWGSQFCGLVAHELGHWFLDPTQSAKTIADIKTVLGGEGSPAVVKVEAYGARERQELQANVFARELLLPRRLARKLALRSKGAYAIAEDFGIPLEFVRQQMLDGLLLPESNEAEAALKPASADQEKAAKATEQFANVVAGPGTGKTSTLIHRIKYLIEDEGVEPSELLVLTFTNKAALELVERLRSAGIANAADIWAGTFHAFGLEFLRKYHQRFGLEADLNVVDKMFSVSALITALPELQLKYYLRVQDPYDWLGPIVNGIARLKEELVSPGTYRKYILEHKVDDEELQRRREDVATLYEAHEAVLSNKKVVDFVDLIAKPALSIATDRVPFSELIDRFKYILVDEYQDVTQAMVELLRQLAYKKSLWVVGDIRQAIHHWRGASLKSLLKFDNEFKSYADGKKIGKYPLKYNRRSRPEILNLVQEVGRRHVLQAELPLDPMTETRAECGVKPFLVTCEKRVDILLTIERGIQCALEGGIRYGDQAVLCRGSKELHQTAEHLLKLGVPVLYIGELAERPEIKVLLCLMQLLVERQPRALIGLADIPDLAMPMVDIRLLMDITDENLTYQRARWIHNVSLGLSVEGEAVRKRLQSIIGNFRHNSNPWTFVCDLLLEQRLCLPTTEDDSVAAWVIRIALWQFAYSVRNGDGDMKEARLSRFLLRLWRRQRIGDAYAGRGFPPEAASLNGVRLDTVHGSKGLEFGAVHIGWVNAGHYGEQVPKWISPENVLDIVPPEVLGSSTEEYEKEEAVERNNLLYVAVSRAKERLFLYQEVEYGNDGLAPQLAYCGALVKEVLFKDQKQGQPVAGAKQAFEAPDILPFIRFDTYALCPLQFWYSDVLGLSREQEVDVSVRAQWAIMAALKTVAGSGALTVEALEEEWVKVKLPSEAEDPFLWKDASYAYQRGLKLVDDLIADGGAFAEPTSVVAGQRIQLPWGFLKQTRYSTVFYLVRFNRNRASEIMTLLKPIVHGMEIQGSKMVKLRYILSDRSDDAHAAKRVEATKGFKAAVNLQNGNNTPERGRHCSRCAYTTLCPHAPAIDVS